MTSSHKATEDPDETQASDASQFDLLLASERPCVCVCMCVESKAGGRSVWVHDSGWDQKRDCSSAGGDPAWTQRLDVHGKTCLFLFLWLFALVVPLWTLFCPADHVSGAKRLFCAGMRKLRLDNQVIPSWIVHPIRYDRNYCMHVTPGMLERWLLGKCCSCAGVH